MSSAAVPLGWLAHIVVCFYFVRPLRQVLHRAIWTILPCSILLLIGCHHLPPVQMSSVMIVSLQWMTAIRLLHLIVLSPNEVQSLGAYSCRFLWFVLPVVPWQSKTPVHAYLLSALIKIVLNHWIFQWMRVCEPNDSYGRLGMFYFFICTSTFTYDLQVAFVRLITRDRYSVIEFNDYPFLSKSIREFWGRRYNRLVNTLLKESIFDPVRRFPHSSKTIAALASFIASGLLHAHVATAAMGASSPLPSFMFFVLQGTACCVESICPFTVPKPLGIVMTHAFLLVTSPLYVGLFTRAGPVFYETSEPVLSNAAWFPKLPVPHFCPK